MNKTHKIENLNEEELIANIGRACTLFNKDNILTETNADQYNAEISWDDNKGTIDIHIHAIAGSTPDNK